MISNFIKENKVGIFITFIMLSGVSFGIGSLEAVVSSSCKYESLISRINIAYVTGCELWEKRFAKEKKCVAKKVIKVGGRNPNYHEFYRKVFFKDGTAMYTTVTEDLSEMIGMPVQYCAEQDNLF